jgi:hypothetical protein
MAQRRRNKAAAVDPVKLTLIGGAALILYQLFLSPAAVQTAAQLAAGCCGK